jgi:hypothetical protein
MKTLTTLLACVAITVAFGQTEPSEKPVRFIFKMSPQHLIMNTLKIGGELLNKDRTKSFQVMLHAIANDKSNADYYYWSNGAPYNGVGAEFTFKKYLSPMQEMTTRKGRQYMQGIYFGGIIQGGAYSRDFDGFTEYWDMQTQSWISERYTYSIKAQNIAAGFTIGFHRIYWKVLSLDAFMGAGYQLRNQKTTGETPDYYGEGYDFTYPNYYGILPKVGLNIGVTL